MRHRAKTVRLSRDTAHRKAMLRNMLTSFFLHEKIETTAVKAKVLKPLAEKMITLAKRGDLHARRQAEAILHGHQICTKLFGDAKTRFIDRQSGYVRIVPARVRRGDAAPMALVELISPGAAAEKK
ncbi:50S ribosomal subunit protein L17 [Desulfarculales bacterium]